MEKKYLRPEMEITEFETEDVIDGSNDSGGEDQVFEEE